MIGGHPKAVKPAEFRCLVVTDQLAIRRKSAYNRVYVHYRGGASRGDPSRIRWGCLLSFRGSLRRFVTGGVDLPPVETEPVDVESVVESFESTAAMTGDGLIERYARRAQTRTAPHPETYAPVIESIGRGTPEHATAIAATAPTLHRSDPTRPRRTGRQHSQSDAIRQRLIAAGLAITFCLTGFAGTAHAQQRYVVQPGDTLESVAAEFGVDPDAIARSSWLSNPPELTPGDVIIIPDIGQSPEEAAQVAIANEGTSPWTTGVYWVVDGDTIESIASAYDVDPEALLAINGLSWNDYIYAGQRLLIPGSGDVPSALQSNENGPYLANGARVPAYQQARTLSCEYAAVYIATSALGYGIPESVFIESIGVTENPHYGFRGDIDAAWGGYDNYGIYPEPLVADPQDYGYQADIFYSDGDPTS